MLVNEFGAQGNEGWATGDEILYIMGLVALVSSPLVLILGAIGGVGMRSERSWARIVAMLAAAVSLFQIPIGTVFGILALRFLFASETKAFYAELKQRGA